MKSQNKLILAHLKKGLGLTPLGAFNYFGSLRLAARISNLREQGHNIKTEQYITGNNKRVARYTLIK